MTEPSGWRPPPFVTERRVWVPVAAATGLLVLGVWLVIVALPGILSTETDGSASPPAPAPTPSVARTIQATLFYASEDGSGLVPVVREVPYGATPTEQVRRLLEAQVAEPPDGQRSAIPAGTTVQSVFLTGDGQAFVDFGGAIVSGHPGGSLGEALTVYAIINAVTVNLPNISAVQILVGGQQVDSLAGHLDLRYPLGKSLDWVRKGL